MSSGRFSTIFTIASFALSIPRAPTDPTPHRTGSVQDEFDLERAELPSGHHHVEVTCARTHRYLYLGVLSRAPLLPNEAAIFLRVLMPFPMPVNGIAVFGDSQFNVVQADPPFRAARLPIYAQIYAQTRKHLSAHHRSWMTLIIWSSPVRNPKTSLTSIESSARVALTSVPPGTT